MRKSGVILMLIIPLMFLQCSADNQQQEADSPDIAKRADSLQTQSDNGSQPDTSILGERVKYTLSYAERSGRLLFREYCTVCHGEKGEGDGFNAWNLQPRPADLTNSEYFNALPDKRIAEAVREGGTGVQKSSGMPSWGKTFSDREIRNLVAYVRVLSRPDTTRTD